MGWRSLGRRGVWGRERGRWNTWWVDVMACDGLRGRGGGRWEIG